MTNRDWAKRLGVSERVVWSMGGASRLEAMTELGREIYVLVCGDSEPGAGEGGVCAHRA